MMSSSTELVLGLPEELNPRARASLSSGVANFVWIATTGGSVIHCVSKLSIVGVSREHVLTEEIP